MGPGALAGSGIKRLLVGPFKGRFPAHVHVRSYLIHAVTRLSQTTCIITSSAQPTAISAGRQAAASFSLSVLKRRPPTLYKIRGIGQSTRIGLETHTRRIRDNLVRGACEARYDVVPMRLLAQKPSFPLPLPAAASIYDLLLIRHRRIMDVGRAASSTHAGS